MASTRRKRKKYTAQQRTTILAAAQKEGLTALDVKKKFGVAPVTYYSWRKKTGVTARRGGRGALLGRRLGLGIGFGGDLSNQLRSEVRSKVREILPEIVRGEVNQYLSSLFGNTGRGRGRRQV
jgi:transposase-like protein